MEGGLRPPISSTRKRSASTENVPIMKWPGSASSTAADAADDYNRATIPLITTFSKDAQEGAGLKARRLSTCSPYEIFVDYCDLDREFASSSKIPFRRGKHVGEGATATVRLMYRKGDPCHSLFAVKEFRRKDKDEPEDEYVKKVKSEFSIAKSLHHPNIVDTVRLCTYHGRWNHVMEYCAYGEMFQYVDKGFFRTVWSQRDRLCFFKQLVRGVDYLHCHGIAHRDIKLENLLLTSEGTLKITDFGVSEVFSGEHPGLRASGGQCGKNMGEVRRCTPGLCGSMPYIAPEVLEKKGNYDPRPLDVWSCAIVYLTMSFKGSPWPAAQTKYELYGKFKAGWDKWLHDHPDGVISDSSFPSCGPLFKMVDVIGGPAIKRLLLKMLNPDPDRRISIQHVLKSSTMKSIECCSEESYEDVQGCCFDAGKSKVTTSDGKKVKAQIKRKHNHVPPKEHKTPKVFKHRFDMGDGYS
jgi:serine/threonine protein kinase